MRPLPQIDGADAPFWQALRRREVQVQRCGGCGTHRFPATRYCAHCRSDDSAGSRSRRAARWSPGACSTAPYFEDSAGPYTVIQVRLDCGVRVFSNPAGVSPSDLRIGMPLEAVFEDVTDDVTLLKFKPRTVMKAMVVRAPGGTDVLGWRGSPTRRRDRRSSSSRSMPAACASTTSSRATAP